MFSVYNVLIVLIQDKRSPHICHPLLFVLLSPQTTTVFCQTLPLLLASPSPILPFSSNRSFAPKLPKKYNRLLAILALFQEIISHLKKPKGRRPTVCLHYFNARPYEGKQLISNGY